MTQTHTVDVGLRQTALTARHRALGARMMAFGGWDMPVEYSGISAEHNAVRNRAGLFDVSHMGEIEVAGPDALSALQRILCNDAESLGIGHVQYSAVTTHEGTFVDDVLVYRLGPTHYLLVVNASNIAKDYAWIKQEIALVGDVAAVNTSNRYSLLALQGPQAIEVLQPLTGVELKTLGYYRFATGEVGNVRATISRTGYTGEDGFEVFVPPQSAGDIWDTLLAEGEGTGLKPVGLGARDTLRLEAGMRLYGSDMDDTTTVLEAGLEGIVSWDKPAFNGKSALVSQRKAGPKRRLVGFEVTGRGIARRGYHVYAGDNQVGEVTSGTMTPFLRKAIGMAYVPIDLGDPGTEIRIDVRSRLVPARVIKMPFYSRAKPGGAVE